MNRKRLLIIAGVILAIYGLYILVIRKWMQENGYNTKITGFSGYTPSTGSFTPADLETISIQQVQGLERV